MTVALSLLSAFFAGTSDFIGGLGSRKAPALSVTTLSHAVGFVVAVVIGFAAGGDPTSSDLGWGALAGIGGAVGLLSLYQGFAKSRVSIVAPVAGVGAAAIPVLWDRLNGASLASGSVVGIGLGLVAIALISMERSESRGSLRRGLLFGAGGAAGLGTMFVFFGQTGEDSGIWPLVPARATGFVLLATVMLVTGVSARTARPARLEVIGAGVAGTIANGLFIAATQVGSLATAAVITSMFPAATVLWARVVFKENLRRVQILGLVMALVAVALIAGSST
ncbi:MAG: EamA family transporter [Acidimicrobiales bacterium]